MRRLITFILPALLLAVVAPPARAGETTEDIQARIEKRQDTILRVLDKLAFQKGLLFSGRIRLFYDVDRFDGPAITTNFAVWRNNTYLRADLKMEFSPSPFIYGGWTIRLQNDVGNFWGGGSIGARDLFLRMDLYDFIRLNLGNFRHSATPFSLWAPVPGFFHEPEVFLTSRNDDLANVYLDAENKWPLQGLKVSTGFYSDHVVDEIHLNGFAALLSENPLRVLYGGRVNLLRRDRVIDVGATYVGLNDIKESITPQMRTMLESGLVAVDGEINPVRLFGVFGEYGYSRLAYHTNSRSGTVAKTNYAENAVRGGVRFSLAGSELKAMFLSVGNEYFAPGAQTPTWDTSDNSELSSAQDMRAGFMERTYNANIRSSRSFDHALFLAFPMGLATPNREGFRVDFSSKAVRSLDLQACAFDLHSIRPVSTSNVRHYTGFQLGCRLDLAGLSDAAFLPAIDGFYSAERLTRPDDPTSTTLDESEKLDVAVWGAGLKFKITSKLGFQAGYERKRREGRFWISVNPDLNPLSGNMVNTLKTPDLMEQTAAFALQYAFTKEIFVSLEYHYREYWDMADESQSYHVNMMQLQTSAIF
jgi:hypothetical protein